MLFDSPVKRLPRVPRFEVVEITVGRYRKLLDATFPAADDVLRQSLIVLLCVNLGIKHDDPWGSHLGDGIRMGRILCKITLVPVVPHVNAALMNDVGAIESDAFHDLESERDVALGTPYADGGGCSVLHGLGTSLGRCGQVAVSRVTN